MEKITKVGVLGTLLLAGMTTTAEASFIRAVNGIDYEWMELAATNQMSRDEVESLLADPSSSLYGFRYATRAETEALLRSYSEFPAELNTFYAYMAPGAQAFFSDFGITFTENYGTTLQHLTTDGVLIDYNQSLNAYFLHGAPDECGVGMSCVGRMYTYALDGVVQAWDPVARRGADATYTDPHTYFNYDSDMVLSSLLVADITAVPLPAAAWLFASGLMGLVLVSRRKKFEGVQHRSV